MAVSKIPNSGRTIIKNIEVLAERYDVPMEKIWNCFATDQSNPKDKERGRATYFRRKKYPQNFRLYEIERLSIILRVTPETLMNPLEIVIINKKAG